MEQPDALDQAALDTVTAAHSLMQWFRDNDYSHQQAFCVMTHAIATLYQAWGPKLGNEVKDAAVTISRRIFHACNASNPMAGAQVVREET